MIDYLKVRNITIQEKRLREAIGRVDPEGVLLRSLQLKVISRKKIQSERCKLLAYRWKPQINKVTEKLFLVFLFWRNCKFVSAMLTICCEN